MASYQTKRHQIEAHQWNPGNLMEAGSLIGILMGHGVYFRHPEGLGATTTLLIDTAEGEQTAQPGDWVIQTAADEWAVVPAAEFVDRYEPAADGLPGIA